MDLTLPDDIHLESPTAADHIADALRGYILDGTLKPGAVLRELPLSEAFKVSRNTIREAIRTLVSEGLAAQARHRSAVVADLAEQDTEDLYRARLLLERSAVENLDVIPSARLANVEAAFDQLERRVALGDWPRVVGADLDFHQSIVALHGSPRIERYFESIKSELAFCLTMIRVYEEEDRKPEALIGEHAAICRAIVERDGDLASRLLAEHLGHYGERARAAAADRAL